MLVQVQNPNINSPPLSRSTTYTVYRRMSIRKTWGRPLVPIYCSFLSANILKVDADYLFLSKALTDDQCSSFLESALRPIFFVVNSSRPEMKFAPVYALQRLTTPERSVEPNFVLLNRAGFVSLCSSGFHGSSHYTSGVSLHSAAGYFHPFRYSFL